MIFHFSRLYTLHHFISIFSIRWKRCQGCS